MVITPVHQRLSYFAVYTRFLLYTAQKRYVLKIAPLRCLVPDNRQVILHKGKELQL